jgi:5-methylcytosine-specific restriction endonuclease McrA
MPERTLNARVRFPERSDTMPQPRARPNARPDHSGPQRRQFESNKRKIYATQKVCGICGNPVDFRLKFPHPLSPCIDHIIPVAKGGHPSDLSNLQLAHMYCNRQKSDRLVAVREVETGIELISNRALPLTFDWKSV